MKLVTIDFAKVAADCSNPDGARLFNTSFHTTDEIDIPRPSEDPYSFTRWLPLIIESRHLDASAAQVVTLSPSQTRLLLQAASASIITGRLNESYLEDLQDEIAPSFSSLTFPSCGLFMRLEQCSPKDGKGTRSFHSVDDIILRLSTSERACNALRQSLDTSQPSIPVVFLPFNERMKSEREYRVFCTPGEGKIATVSQYCWHKPWMFHTHSAEEMDAIIRQIWDGIRLIHQQIMQSLDDSDEMDQLLRQQGFSFDVFYDEETGGAELVELNVFGATSGCGSCLFHWVQDFDLMYGVSDEVEFRVAM